jgi:hypothetical protein
VVPVRIGVVFDQVQVRTVRKGVSIHVPVRSIQSQVFALLDKVGLRLTGESCDVVWFYYFLVVFPIICIVVVCLILFKQLFMFLIFFLFS